MNNLSMAMFCEFTLGLAILLFSYLMYVENPFSGLWLIWIFVAGFAFFFGFVAVGLYLMEKYMKRPMIEYNQYGAIRVDPEQLVQTKEFKDQVAAFQKLHDDRVTTLILK